MATTVFVFSKDRPWQLSEYIRTFRKYGSGIYDFVILWTSDLYQKQYQDVIKHYSSPEFNCKFIEQKFTDTFAKETKKILDDISNPYILFGVDDVVWYDHFNVVDAENTLRDYSNVASYSFRLHAGITWCQPARIINKIPPLSKFHNGAFYDRRYGTGDFNYPLELSASMYHLKTIQECYKKITQTIGFPRNPNELEDWFQRVSLSNQWNENVCINRHVCSVITINRVQELYKNNIYNQEFSLETINEWFKTHELDTEKYKNTHFKSIHIGELFVKIKN